MHKITELVSNEDRAPAQVFPLLCFFKMRFKGTIIKREVFMEEVEFELLFEEHLETTRTQKREVSGCECGKQPCKASIFSVGQ